jgi:hypothetical protein
MFIGTSLREGNAIGELIGVGLTSDLKVSAHAPSCRCRLGPQRLRVAHIISMHQRFLIALQDLDPVIHVSSLKSVDLGEDADGASTFRVRFARQAGRSLILDIICLVSTVLKAIAKRVELTFHRDDQQNQAVLGNVALHQVLHKVDIVGIFALANILYDTGKVDKGKVRNVRTRDLENNDAPRERELLRRAEGFLLLHFRDLVFDEVGGLDRRVEDGELSATDGNLD